MREPGFYWVKWHDGELDVGEWLDTVHGMFWVVGGNDELFMDGDFSTIGPKIEEPEE